MSSVYKLAMRWLAASKSVMFPEHAGSEGLTAQSGRTEIVRKGFVRTQVQYLNSPISEPTQS
jgi:hypothetical protein